MKRIVSIKNLFPERTTTITKLNLSACNLGENIVPLLKTLEGNITLTALDLSYNNPPKSAIKALDKLLSVNFTLTSINLKSHSLDPLVSKDSEWILQSLVDNAGVAKVPKASEDFAVNLTEMKIYSLLLAIQATCALHLVKSSGFPCGCSNTRMLLSSICIRIYSRPCPPKSNAWSTL